ncbi:sulfate transporter-like [Mercenaria mercenaria]|uniref:sulfate transporter-like n=1 Tax=Mercenaria mercenaria TaxID=6596 RepID=UPI00234F2E59|nr:sulfate transporter-like [Mercenaria mercenaria]
MATNGTGERLDEGDRLLEQQEIIGQLTDHSFVSQKEFDENYEFQSHPPPKLKQIVTNKLGKCKCSGTCVKRFIYSIFPFINIMKNYNIREDIGGDIVAGLTIGIMHIPQGMAYAMLATLKPVHGLYMSFFPVLLYFFFGSSRHISVGANSVACLMLGSAVSKGIDSLSGSAEKSGLVSLVLGNQTVNQTGSSEGNHSEYQTTESSVADDTAAVSDEELELRLQFAMSVTFLSGAIQLLMSIFRLGFITEYLSDALISGFMTGVSCHIFTSQVKHLFGVKHGRYTGVFKLVYTYRDIFKNIGTANYVTILLAVACIASLYCTSRFINQNPKLKPKMFMPVPIELIVVVLATVISYAIKLEENFDVAVVSDIPTGLPIPNARGVSRISGLIIPDAFALGIVIFSIYISMGKMLAKKHDYEVDANQELMAFGVSTIICSFFTAAAPSVALSRSIVQERVGGKTQVAGLVSCCLLLVVLLAVGPYFRTTPNCVLSSIVVVAIRGMFLQVLDLKKIWNVSSIDFFVWIVACIATVLMDVDLGLGTAVAFNIIVAMCRIQRPNACLLGHVPGTDIYIDMNFYQKAREIPAVKIFRFEQSLFFLNKEHFRTLLYKNTVNPNTLKIAQDKREKKLRKLQKKEPIIDGEVRNESAPEREHLDIELNILPDTDLDIVDVTQRNTLHVDFHTIIFDCSLWSFVDSMGVKVLKAVIGEYKAVGIKVLFANCKVGVREMFEKTKFYDTLDQSNIYVSVHDAVIHSIQAYSFKNGANISNKEGSPDEV